jgi:hypothetical protein
MSRLFALVGGNIGEARWEAGDRIPDASLTDKQRKYLLDEGLVLEVESGQPIPAEVKAAAAAGAGNPNPQEVV